MNTSIFFYSAKVWMTAIFMAPFFQVCIDLLTKPYVDAGYYIYSAVSMGAMLAIPSIILFWFAALSMKKIAYSTVLSKLFLTMAGLILTVLFIYFTQKFNDFTAEGLFLPVPYFATIVLAIWSYDLPVLDKQVYLETVNA